MTRSLPLASILACVFASLTLAQTIVIWPPPPPHPLPPPHIIQPVPIPSPRLELRTHQVHVTIRDQVATTRIEQVFYNPSPRRAEGTFLLPMPRGAKIDKFTMDVNGQDTPAELLAADKARAIYEDIVRRACDPALLEFMDHDLLKARIFPIEPHSEKRVTLTYTHLLPNDAGLVGYSYPLIGRTIDIPGGRPVCKLSMKIDLHSSSSLASIYAPSHPVEINRRGDRDATIGLETAPGISESGNFQLYFAPTPSGSEDVALNLLTFRDPAAAAGGGDEGFFLLLASPSTTTKTEPLSKDIVFVLDTSGSMSSEKLEQARRALNFCLDNLNEGDRFEIVRFSTDVEPLFNSLQPADDEHRGQARAFLKKLKPIGGTAVHDALKQALESLDGNDKQRPGFVVFLTDGRPTIGNTDPAAIVTMADGLADDERIFCFGIGTDINTHLLDTLAEKGRAATEYVLPDEDIELKVSRFYTKIAEPVMTDLSIAADGVRLTQMTPPQLPDLFRGEQLVLFGRYDGAGDATVTLTGRVSGEERTITRKIAFPQKATDHEHLPQLWAMRRVGYLLDEIRLRGENAELRDEVTRLARDFGIVTPYTAYLIVEDEDRRAIPVDRQSLMGLSRDRDRRDGARFHYEQMATADTGAAGVAGSYSNTALKVAQAPQAAAEANEWAAGEKLAALGAAVPTVTGPAPGKPALQQARHVKGRTFIQNGPQWIDTQTQALPKDAAAQRVVFNSDAYFQLLKDHPEAAPWLSVARSLRIVIADQLYDIVDES